MLLLLAGQQGRRAQERASLRERLAYLRGAQRARVGRVGAPERGLRGRQEGVEVAELRQRQLVLALAVVQPARCCGVRRGAVRHGTGWQHCATEGGVPPGAAVCCQEKEESSQGALLKVKSVHTHQARTAHTVPGTPT